jgi:hypothetical protein
MNIIHYLQNRLESTYFNFVSYNLFITYHPLLYKLVHATNV